MIYKIPKDSHSPFRIPRFHLGRSYLNFRFKFDDSCGIPSIHVNKLYGISYGHHHHNSIRIGWQFYDKGKLNLFLYTYNNKEREIRYITSIETGVVYECKIVVNRDNIKVALFNPLINKEVFTKVFENYSFRILPGYYLFPYYGGIQKAPKELKIYIQKLK